MLSKLNIKIQIKNKKSKVLTKFIEKSVDEINEKIKVINKNSGQNLLIYRQVEILIDNLLVKINGLEKSDNVDLSIAKISLNEIKQQVIEHTLEMAKNAMQTVDELIISEFTASYSQYDNTNGVVLECFKKLDEETLIRYLEIREKVFNNSLTKFVLNNDPDLYWNLCEQASNLSRLLKENKLISFREARQFIEKIKYILSTKKEVDLEQLIDSIAEAKNESKKEALKDNISEICKKWFGINDANAKVECVSVNNNIVFKFSYNNIPFVFMCSDMPLENKSILNQLQQSSARKYLVPELYAASYEYDSRSRQEYRYNLMPWYENGNFEDFAITIMNNEQISLEDKQKKILIALTNMINMVLDFRKENVVFPDIKPSNFLVSGDKHQACLGDWKTLFTCNVNNSIEWRNFIITPAYMPPEQVSRGNRDYETAQCDDLDKHQAFMFGIVLYQMMHGWNAEEIANVMCNGSVCYTAGKCHLSFDDAKFAGSLGHAIKILIQAMVNPSQESRPALLSVLNQINECLTNTIQFSEVSINELFNANKENLDLSLEKPTWKKPSITKLEKQKATFFCRDKNNSNDIKKMNLNCLEQNSGHLALSQNQYI